MPLVGGSGSNPKIVLDAYVDKTDFDAKVAAIQSRLNATNDTLKKQNEALTQSTKQSTLSWTDFRSAYLTVLDAVRVGEQVWNATIAQSNEYADVIREISSLSGQNVKDTSQMVQVLDDYKISTSDILVATKALTKEGYAPNIETLAQLSDKYLALNTVQDKNRFITENLGKAGFKWVEFLEQGGDAIRRMSEDVNGALVLNQKQVDASRALEFAQDDLADSTKGAAIAFGNYMTPALEAIIRSSTGAADGLANFFAVQANNRTLSIEVSRLLKEQGYFTGIINTATREQMDAIILQAQANIEAANTTQTLNDGLETEEELMTRLAAESQAAAEAVKEVSRANQGMLSLVGTIQNEMDSYNEKWGKAVDQYGEASQEVKDLEAAHKKAMAQIAVDLFIAKLSVDGLTDAEFEAALQAQLSAGIIDEETVAMARAFDKSTASAYAEVKAIERIGGAASAISGTYNLQIITSYVNQGVPPSVATNPNNNLGGSGGSPTPGYASGTQGWRDVPAGYANDSYMIRMQSGEEFNVRQKGQKGGDGATFHIDNLIVYANNAQEFAASIQEQFS